MSSRWITQFETFGVRPAGLSSRGMFWLAAWLAAIILACVWVLERRFDGLAVETGIVEGTPVTYYHRPDALPAAPVVVAHGFGGSHQMMEQIAHALARQGFFVASVDLPGHGRHTQPLSRDVTRIEGTTSQLVAAVTSVTDHVVAHRETSGPVSFVGHSMATDVVIRAASQGDDVGGIAAISMYSTAITDTAPAALLMLSGARETHLREAALEALHKIDPDAAEGQTVAADTVTRRAAVIPNVGHVGVLYHGDTLDELTDWLREATGTGDPIEPPQTAWIAGLLLVAITLIAWPLAWALPQKDTARSVPISPKLFWLCITLPLPLSVLPALLPIVGIAGQASFGTLAVCLAVWGTTQLGLLQYHGIGIPRPDWLGAVVYLFWGCVVFALALDRYGASFAPTGNRLWVMLGLLLGTVPLMAADTLLSHNAPIWRRFVARVMLLSGLAAAVAVAPTDLGLAFTVLPVLVLFFLVYGSFGKWIAARRGPEGAMLGMGVALAWAISASTPLFSVRLIE
ncbi:MAG: alpha/beta fold hydrolase [Pseudomonadota bacterium]